ncbi:hypothetical protein ACBI01_001142 [Aeromonas veronii]
MRAHIFLATLLISGCTVPDKVWQPVCPEGNECDLSAITLKEKSCFVPQNGRNIDCTSNKSAHGKQHSFKIAYLEYPEDSVNRTQTSLLDPKQLELIIKELRSSKRPLLIPVYVHGWHHNASSDDDNFRKFPNMLARYSYALQQSGHSNYDVLGIYIGWRGESYDGLFSTLTIGGRAKTADKIGRENGPLSNDLIYIANKMQSINSKSRMIVMGHSLGGRVLSRAFLPSIKSGNYQPLGAGTLIITANAAIGADAYRPLYESTQTSTQARTPTWINFTAKDDTATNTIYPLALNLHLLSPDYPDNQQDTDVTIGHYQPYITHQITIQNCKPNGVHGESSCGKISELDAMSYTDYWKMSNYRLFTLKYGDPSTPSSLIRHCVFMVDYPRTEVLDSKIKMENKNLCRGVFEYDYDKATNANKRIPANGHMWNVRVDASVFDFAKPSTFMDFSTHNGYIQTDLTTMLLQLAFENDINLTTTKK